MKLTATTWAHIDNTPDIHINGDRIHIILGNNSFFVDINDWVELSRAVVAAIDAANEKAGAA